LKLIIYAGVLIFKHSCSLTLSEFIFLVHPSISFDFRQATMSSKGKSGSSSQGGTRGDKSTTSSSSGKGSTSSTSSSFFSSSPSVVQGWDVASNARQPTKYAAERYAYIGKDDSSGEPMFIDYGAKGNKK
jgi:hypothetical protein